MTTRTYKIRKVSNGYGPGGKDSGKKIINRYFTVPKEIADLTPEDDEFVCEMTEEGILYRRVDVDALKPKLPSWAVSGEANGKGAKPKSARPRPSRAAGGAKRKRPSRTKT